MSDTFKVTAVPSLLLEGDFKGTLETITFVAESATETHKWWTVNTGRLKEEFGELVSVELAGHIVTSLGSSFFLISTSGHRPNHDPCCVTQAEPMRFRGIKTDHDFVDDDIGIIGYREALEEARRAELVVQRATSPITIH